MSEQSLSGVLNSLGHAENEILRLREELKTVKALVALGADIEAQFVDGSPEAMVAEITRLRAALQRLYDETADYITINHLGDVHHNSAMKLARDALADTQPLRRWREQEKLP